MADFSEENSIRLSEIVKCAPGNIYWKNKDLIYVGCNNTQAQTYNRTCPEEVIGRRDLDLYHEKFSHAITERDKLIIKEKKSFFGEEQGIDSKGETATYLTHKVPLLNKEGEVFGLIGTSLDITKYKKQADELHEAKKEVVDLKDVIAVTPGNVYWKNAQLEFEGCNENHAKMFDLSHSEQIKGLKNEGLFDPELAEIVDQRDRQILESGKTFYDEEEGVDNNHNTAYYLTKKVPLINDQREAYGLIGVSLDITERKKQEQELLLAKQAAERNNTLKTEFLNNIRHDIRTPFSGIHGLLELMLVEEANSEKQQKLTLCLDSIKSLLDYCNSMLSTSLNIDKEGEFNVVEFCPQELGEQLKKTYLAAAKQKKIELVIRYTDQIPNSILSYKQAIQRILSNLVDNAIKFTDKGAVEVTFSRCKDASFVIEVKDTGAGIPNEKRLEVFEKFTKLNPSHVSKNKGQGLGLYFIKEICDKLNISIKISDNLPRGTTFTVITPDQNNGD